MVRVCQRYWCLSWLCGLFWVQACQPASTVEPNDGAYAPVESGRYWVYEVREEQYSLSDAPMTATYFLKETVGEQLATVSQGKTFKLIRYKRSRMTDPWKSDSVWTVQQLPDKLIRTEKGISYVKLVFPISNGTSWNSNEYNTLPTTTYQYENTGKSYRVGTTVYPTTMQVMNSQNDSTAISLNRQAEVYAYRTGLIFKETTALAYCQSSPDCIGKGQIAYGYRRRQTLLETGIE